MCVARPSNDDETSCDAVVVYEDVALFGGVVILISLVSLASQEHMGEMVC